MIIDNILKAFHKNNPNPKTELDYNNIFTFLIAVILSAQATDVTVNKATKNLFKKYDSPEKFLLLGEEKLKNYIKTINLYPTKAKNIIKTCKILVEEYNLEVPDSLTELMKLPGVGRKTANVILNSAFGIDTIPVDTHVLRVSNRLGIACGKTPIQVEEQLTKILPKKYFSKAHHWLVLHGRYICKAIKPKCSLCIISKYCNYFKIILENNIIKKINNEISRT